MQKEFVNTVNKLIIDQYYENQNEIRDFFDRTTMNEYVALKEISNHCPGDKIYLKDLADAMQISYQKLSETIAPLSDKGYVTWTHDGHGENGTYLIITQDGLDLLESQEAYLKDFYSRVIQIYGKDKLFQLLSLIKELQDVVKEQTGGKNNGQK